jgi:hypothetical protein
MNRPPPTLAYDDLPPGSDVRREPGLDGVSLRIIVPAGEPPPAVRRQTLLDAFASAAPTTAALLALSLTLFLIGLRTNRISGISLAWAWTFFAVFCGALLLLVAWVRYGMMLDSIRLAREQQTVLEMTPHRLLIETTGPFGVAGYDFAVDQFAIVTLRRAQLRDDRNTPRRLLHLALSLRDGRTILLLPGRDVRELEWITNAMRRVMKVSTSRT